MARRGSGGLQSGMRVAVAWPASHVLHHGIATQVLVHRRKLWAGPRQT